MKAGVVLRCRGCHAAFSVDGGADAPGEGPARVQVGPGAAPKRLDGGGRASKTGNVGPMGIGPAGPR